MKGNHIIAWPSQAAVLPVATAGSGPVPYLFGNDHTYALLFVNDEDNYCYFTSVMPYNYDGNGLKIYIQWNPTQTTGGTTVWEVSFERHQAGTTSLNSANFATAHQISGETSNVDTVITEASIEINDGSDMDDIAAGEQFRIKLERKGTLSSDTGPNAYFMKITLEEGGL